jgi:ribosomal protein L11 methyltransferase
MRWAEIQIDTETNAVDAVGAALYAAGCGGFEVRETAKPPAVAGYLPVDDRLEARLEQLQDALAKLPEFGVSGAGTELTLRYVEEADWATAWKAYYKPMRIGKHLVVTPPWETPELGPDDLAIVVDPGMAFGTGSHPTTQLCLVALEEYVKPGMFVADVGTGSGILAIAAAKLGAGRVAANDIDPLAVKIARENAAINGVTVHVSEHMGPQWDIVVANILADVIIDMAYDFAGWIRQGSGIFIASGIIDTREQDVRQAAEAAGLVLKDARHQGEWVALIFERPGFGRQAAR